LTASSRREGSTTPHDFRGVPGWHTFGLASLSVASTPGEQERGAQTLGEFAQAWLEKRRATLTVATGYDYDRLIKALLLPAPIAEKHLAAIDDGDISRFLGGLMKRKGLNGGQPIGPRRINMMIARLRTILSIAKRRKLINEDPMLFVKNLREPKGDVDPFTLEEAERLIKTATGQDSHWSRCWSFAVFDQTRRWRCIGKTSTSIANNSGFDAASIALPASGYPRPRPANAR
jgi:hypothetical protein